MVFSDHCRHSSPEPHLNVTNNGCSKVSCNEESEPKAVNLPCFVPFKFIALSCTQVGLCPCVTLQHHSRVV